MPEKIAFVFPGQGSQSVGMGKDMAEEFPEVRDIFDQADDICHRDISRLCFEGPMDELTLTVNLQPAITAVNLACPAQMTGSISEVSADFWHDVRLKLRERYGDDLAILGQCSAAGDQSPRVLYRREAEERMRRESGMAHCQSKLVFQLTVAGFHDDQAPDSVE